MFRNQLQVLAAGLAYAVEVGRIRVSRAVGMLTILCCTLVVMTGDLLAQTSGSSFPDIVETVDITEICTKVAAFLAVCVGAVLALKLGMAILSGLMSWFGVGKRRVV